MSEAPKVIPVTLRNVGEPNSWDKVTDNQQEIAGQESSEVEESTENTEVSDTSNESSEELENSETVVASEPAKKVGGHGVEKRIAKLVKEREEAAKEAAYLRGLLAGQGHEDVTYKQPSATSDDSAPNPDDFEDELDYKLAIREHNKEKSAREKIFNDKMKAAYEKYDDLQDLVDEDAVKTNQTMLAIVKESDIAGDLFYYLMSNPDEANTIAKMGPIQTSKALLRIEDKLEAAIKAPVKKDIKVSKAPAPITPVKTNSAKSAQYTSKYEKY